MFKSICWDEALPIETGIVFLSIEGVGLYFLENGKQEITLLTYLPDICIKGKKPYKTMVKFGDQIILPPCESDYIAVYDCGTRLFRTARLETLPMYQDDLYKFWICVVYKDFVYFIGHYYPAIVKMNIHTMKLSYLFDWIKQIGKRREEESTPFLKNAIVHKDALLMPCRCTNAILKLDLNTDKTELFEVETNKFQLDGICYARGKYWLTALNRYEIVIWDEKQNYTEIIELKKGESNTGSVLFCQPFVFHNNIYLFPFRADCAYSINTISKEVQKIDGLDSVFNSKQYIDQNYRKVVNIPAIKDGYVYFITGDKKNFHMYNLASKTKMNIPLYISTYTLRMTQIERRKKMFNLFYKRDHSSKGAVTFSEGEGFFCEDFCDFICKYEDGSPSPDFKSRKVNIGQTIYSMMIKN